MDKDLNFIESDQSQRDDWYEKRQLDCVGSEENTADRCGWIKRMYSEWLIKGKRILDVACRDGFVTRSFLKDSCSITGIDICKDAVNTASKMALKKYSDKKWVYLPVSIDDYPWELSHGKFDLIICFEFIEHIPSEKVSWLIGKLHNTVSKNGFVAMSTPQRDGKYGINGDDVSHINLYTAETLSDEVFNATQIRPRIEADQDFLYCYWSKK